MMATTAILRPILCDGRVIMASVDHLIHALDGWVRLARRNSAIAMHPKPMASASARGSPRAPHGAVHAPFGAPPSHTRRPGTRPRRTQHSRLHHSRPEVQDRTGGPSASPGGTQAAVIEDDRRPRKRSTGDPHRPFGRPGRFTGFPDPSPHAGGMKAPSLRPGSRRAWFAPPYGHRRPARPTIRRPAARGRPRRAAKRPQSLTAARVGCRSR
jgi:hypothetical protein